MGSLKVDSLKKELASREREKDLCLQKMKENTILSEKKFPNSPLPRSKFSTEHSVMRLRRLSLEVSGNENGQHQTIINSESDQQQQSQIEEEQLKDVAHEVIISNETIESFSQVNEIEGLLSCSGVSNSASVNQLTTLGKRCKQLSEVKTPDTTRNKLSSNTFSSSKGSHIRKSLQTIGKLINGSEKRNYQGPSVIPPKQDKDLHAVKKSPATVESRYKRRQSLINVQAFEIKASRRSSLGGKPIESNSAVRPGLKTPPAFPASTRATNRWL